MSVSRPPKLYPLRHWLPRAAVAVIHRNGEHGTELFLIQRAQRPGDPWSGDMAFPGGRRQREDPDSRATAMRETWEETGLDLFRQSHCHARLSDVVARTHRLNRPMIISPWLFEWHGEVHMHFNHEVADALWIPLRYFANHANRSSIVWQRARVSIDMPCYYYADKPVWGLTLNMIDDLLHRQVLSL